MDLPGRGPNRALPRAMISWPAEYATAEQAAGARDQRRGAEIPHQDHHARIVIVDQRQRGRRDGRDRETAHHGDRAAAQ